MSEYKKHNWEPLRWLCIGRDTWGNATRQILTALVFASAILLASYLMRDSRHDQTVQYLLIALWFVPFSMLTSEDTNGACS